MTPDEAKARIKELEAERDAARALARKTADDLANVVMRCGELERQNAALEAEVARVRESLRVARQIIEQGVEERRQLAEDRDWWKFVRCDEQERQLKTAEVKAAFWQREHNDALRRELSTLQKLSKAEDGAWNAAIEAAARIVDQHHVCLANHVRALARAEEGERHWLVYPRSPTTGCGDEP